MKRINTGKADRQVAGQPVDAAGVPVVRLRPGMAAHAAARQILRQSLVMMRANEAGIKTDADIEFLHEYRVAVRRTRSALSQIRNVFPPEKVEYFKREFGHLGRRTNDLRNLDVFLSMESGYRGRLSDDMREDITPLFNFLRSRRSKALSVVVGGLESKTYGRFLAEWDCFLSQPIGESHSRNARKPIIKLARGRIERQYHTILREGAHALHHPNDDTLHTLRIEGKKLRYLLEFFAELFPPEDTVPLLNQLKRLQTNLGMVSDLGDQRNYLYSIAEMPDIERVQTRRALLATGFLIEAIAREQQAAKANFAKTFKRFSSPTNQKQFQKMMN